MRDLFNTNPYGRYDMGRFAAPAFARQVKMGCELHADYADYSEEDHEEELDQKTLACKKCAKKHRRTSGRLAGASMGDDLLDSAKSVFDGLLGTFADLVKNVPPQAAGVYQSRLKSCQDMVGINPNTGAYIAAAACLRNLYEDMKSGKGLPAPTPVMTMQQPQPSSFPIVPVAIAVVGGLAIFYVMSTMKKKPGKK